jgi:hypothetical protein
MLTSPPFPVSSELETGGFSAVDPTLFGRSRSGLNILDLAVERGLVAAEGLL